MKSAVLVIDVQRGLFDPEPRPYEADAVVGRINTLTARAREAGVPVVFIQHEGKGGYLEYGTQDWQLEQRLLTVPGDSFVPAHRTRRPARAMGHAATGDLRLRQRILRRHHHPPRRRAGVSGTAGGGRAHHARPGACRWPADPRASQRNTVEYSQLRPGDRRGAGSGRCFFRVTVAAASRELPVMRA